MRSRLIALGILSAVCLSGVAQAQEAATVRVTYYLPTGHTMANQQMPYPGAAACSTNWSLGTHLRFPDGREVVCADRGDLGDSGWVDIFVQSDTAGRALARQYGRSATVEVVR